MTIFTTSLASGQRSFWDVRSTLSLAVGETHIEGPHEKLQGFYESNPLNKLGEVLIMVQQYGRL
jgi:hypothetical protein